MHKLIALYFINWYNTLNLFKGKKNEIKIGMLVFI